MIIYFVSFFLSSLLLVLSEKVKASNKKIVVAVALLIPITLAGLRKIGIGTDTEVYVNVLYDAARTSNSFLDYLGKKVYSSFQMKPVSNWEIGYNLLVYIATKITHSFQGVLFFTHLLIITFIYKGLVKLHGDFSRAWAMLIFYFMFYASSLNLMRQWIAIAIIFYGLHFLQKGQTKKYLFCVIFAMIFHNSAIIGIVVWLIYKFFTEFNSKQTLSIGSKKLDADANKVFLFIGICAVFLIGLSLFANLLGAINDVFARYVRLYISGSVQIMPMQIIRRVPIIVLLMINWNRLNNRECGISFFYGMLIADTAISQLGSLTAQSSRMGYFFSIFEIVVLAELTRGRKMDWKILYGIVLIMYLIIFFYYDNVLMGRAEIVPYMFYFE